MPHDLADTSVLLEDDKTNAFMLGTTGLPRRKKICLKTQHVLKTSYSSGSVRRNMSSSYNVLIFSVPAPPYD